jgi:hypothetical protein
MGNEKDILGAIHEEFKKIYDSLKAVTDFNDYQYNNRRKFRIHGLHLYIHLFADVYADFNGANGKPD